MGSGKIGNKGVALLLVLTAIAILTTAVTEFSYNTNINYNLALNERDRIAAYNLAKSALRFMLLELKFDRVYRGMVSKYNLGQYLGAAVQQPLCQQFPMSTELIRGVFLEGNLEGLFPMGAEGEEGGAAPENVTQTVSMSDREGAADFLDFRGDFDAECMDESTKLSLNGFYGLKATAAEGKVSELDSYKVIFTELLQSKAFKNFFSEDDMKPEEIVDNIADWVDSDELANKIGGGTSGLESSVYDRADLNYPIRSGKLLSLGEAYLIEGVVSKWFVPISPRLTVYGDGKINPCTSDQMILETLIKNYVFGTPGLPPVKIDDPETMESIISSVLEACDTGASGDALINQTASNFANAIGVTSGGEVSVGMIKDDFKKLLTSEARFFSLKLNGTVDPINVKVYAVIDIKESDPKKWKMLYWRIQ